MRRGTKIALGSVGAAIAFALGATTGTWTVPSIQDWMNFAGALVGASITVLGGLYVLDRERGREDRERRELLIALLDDVEAACAGFHFANEAALKSHCGRGAKAQVREVEGAIRRIQLFGEILEPTTARMLKVAHAIDGLPTDFTEMTEAAKVAAFYPDSADFGLLNSLGHDLVEETNSIRKLLD